MDFLSTTCESNRTKAKEREERGREIIKFKLKFLYLHVGRWISRCDEKNKDRVRSKLVSHGGSAHGPPCAFVGDRYDKRTKRSARRSPRDYSRNEGREKEKKSKRQTRLYALCVTTVLRIVGAI